MKVLLLAGGDSSERTVSLKSGKAVYEALSRLGHEIHAIDPSTGRSLLTGDGSYIEIKSETGPAHTAVVKSGASALTKALGASGSQDVEVVFITLHGGAGENGMIQCLLDLAGRKYTGSGMTASAIAMDKAVSKRLCQSEGIPTPDWALYRLRHQKVDDQLIGEITRRFTCPIIVKPNDGGSTIGLTKVHKEDELRQALLNALKESSDILVEKFIAGREITAAVLDGQPLPLVEIKPTNELYDYEAKYTKGKSNYFCPAEMDDRVTKQIQQAAAKAYHVIGAAGLARADFILDQDNNFYFLELNTLPGMTELSLAPMAANAAGIDFDELITRLINSAILR